MASPVKFYGINKVLRAPPDMPEVIDLFVATDGEGNVSCWEMTDEEIAEIVRTRRVWLRVEGRTHPPLLVSGTTLVDINRIQLPLLEFKND